MNTSIEVRLLGDFTLTQDGRVVGGLDTTRLQALLAYLLLNRDTPQQRQRLAYLFWPDTGESQARANLRNLLHRLRRAWPGAGQVLVFDNKTIGLHPDASLNLDTAEFETHTHQAGLSLDAQQALMHLQAAIRLYRGELLPHLYDEWLLSERERLHQAYLQALEQFVDLHEKQANAKDAIRACRQLIQADPLREAAYRRLMHLYTQAGDRAAALGVYYRCVTVLRRELEVEPDTPTRQAYQKLLELEEPLSLTALPGAPAGENLVGRSLEWERIALTWQQVAAGHHLPGVVLISGEAGIGKTALAKALVAWIKRQGATTASAACYAPEAELPLAPVVAWLRALKFSNLETVWRSELARLLPEQSPSAAEDVNRLPAAIAGIITPVEPWQKQRFFQALARAVLAAKTPVCLHLEDFQWCDRETVTWLHFLLRLEPNARLMLLATLRPEEINPGNPLHETITTWRQQDRLLEIELARLDVSTTGELAAGLLSEKLSPQAVAALYQHTEGNPLFIVETIRSLLERDATGDNPALVRLESALSASSTTAADIPPKIQAVLRARLERLSPVAQRLLGIAAVVGRSFTTPVLLHASDTGEGEMVHALDELWRHRIIYERGTDSYDFSHDKLRQVAYDLLSPVRRRWLHGRVAQALEEASDKKNEKLPGLLAFHYEAAGQAEKALAFHRQAAIAAQNLFAYQEAVFHLQAAISLLDRIPFDESRSTALYELLGDILTLSGQHDGAQDAYRAGLNLVAAHNRLRQAQLTRKIAGTRLAVYELDQAAASFEDVFDLLGDPACFTQADWQTYLDARLGQLDVYYFKADVGNMGLLVENNRLAFEQHGSLNQHIRFLYGTFQMESRHSRFRQSAEVTDYVKKALRLAHESGDQNLIQYCRFGLGFSHLWSGNLEAAIRELQETSAGTQETGNIPLLDRCLAYLSIARRMQGNRTAVRELLPRCLAVAESESNNSYIGVVRANQAWLAYHDGEMTRAVTRARAALKHWQKLVYPFKWLACWPLLAASLSQGDIETAINQVPLMQAAEQQPLAPEIEEVLLTAVRHHPGDPGKVKDCLDQAIELARQHGQL